MRTKYDLPELLAPAGDKESLLAAIAAGADAVYLGGKRFGARAYAKNFEIDEIREATALCHMQGVKLYVTVNTLIYDKEMAEAVNYARELYNIGVDALIVADVGLCLEIKKAVPHLELHASTQMGVHNRYGADLAYSLGCERVVLARECSSKDIEAITANAKAECEVFVHGALCVCHSGQCLFSSLVGGRSGNRGECAQPCRLPYSGKYPLSLSDLSLSSHIRELVRMGVASLKIEGRMKSPEYVYTVTKIYRKLLDECRAATKAEESELRRAFSRGNFTDGYFVEKKTSSMTGVRSEEDKNATREQGRIAISIEKIPVVAKAEFRLGKASSLTFTAAVYERGFGSQIKGGQPAYISATVTGDACSPAINAPLDKSSLEARLGKLGNTPFSLDSENCEILLDDGVNLSPGAINALRRDCAMALEKEFLKPMRRLLGYGECDFIGENIEKASCEAVTRKINTALFLGDRAYSEFKKAKGCDISFDIAFLPLHQALAATEENVGIYVPPVIMERELDEVYSMLSTAKDAGIEYALAGNVGHIPMLISLGFNIVADFRLNISNGASAEFYKGLSVYAAVLSPELTLPMVRDIGGGVIVMGRIPLMLTERCFIKENFGCERCGSASLTDRKGMKFPLVREWGHRNLVLNSTPTYMGDKKGELDAAGVAHCHFVFSTETAEEIKELLECYRREAPYLKPHRRIGKRPV